MENKTGIGKKAFHYRLFTNEIAGIIIIVCLTLVVGAILFFIRRQELLVLTALIFVSLFIFQFILFYVISLVQFKNLKYSIGQNSISLQRGSFGIETQTIPFEKIKNSTFEQTVIQRLFSVGDIIIDQDDEKFVWENIDILTANLITSAVSAKSNIQPIAFSMPNAVVNASQSSN